MPSPGGYTTGRADVIEMLRQKSRPYLFSNSLAPPMVGAAIETFKMLSTTTELRDKLEENTKFFRQELTSAGFNIRPGTHPIVVMGCADCLLR